MKRYLVIHPVLFGLFPALFLFAHNIDQFSLRVLTGPLVIIAGGCLGLVAVLALIFRSLHKGGVLASCIILPFFSYGHFANSIGGTITRSGIGSDIVFCVVWILLLVACAAALVRTKKTLESLTRALNITAGALVAISLVNITYSEITERLAWRQHVTAIVDSIPEITEEIKQRPDIYYIIMDGYARADALKEFHRFDNTPFIQYLESRSFYVATQSRANYCQTHQSLASALNYAYLDEVFSDPSYLESSNREALIKHMADNKVTRLLKRLGYLYVVFETRCINKALKEHADVFITAGPSLSLYEIALLNSTALVTMRPMERLLTLVNVNDATKKVLLARRQAGTDSTGGEELDGQTEPSGMDIYAQHRTRVLYSLEHLADAAAIRSPKFVFAHIISPHPPFIFDAHGNPIQPDRPFTFSDATNFLSHGGTKKEYFAHYRDQLSYINTKLMEAIDGLLSASPEPPIIIIQGDHGSRILLNWKDAEKTAYGESFPILNAYHLPNGGNSMLYEDVTPVNSFRLIFNYYFGTNFEILEDESYFSLWNTPYQFLNVTERVLRGPPRSRHRKNTF